MGIWYTTREAVKSALDIAETARNNTQVDRAIEAGSRAVEGLLWRRFYPEIDTRYFDWPDGRYTASWRLWLDGDSELISITSITSGGTTIAPADYFLEPNGSGPPYDRVEVNRGSSAAFASGDTAQQSIAITGVWGYDLGETPVGVANEALDASETDVDVTNSASIGVGNIIRVDTERMIVTGKAMADTGQNLQTPLTAAKNSELVAVTNGAAFAAGETILLDAERMLIVEVAGNNLIVKRAWDGSTLATHTGSNIYAPRTLTVTRGALGTTAATHSLSAPIYRHDPPGLVSQLALAEAIVALAQESAAYARTAGSGENTRESTGRGVRDLREQARARYGVKMRKAAV